MQQTSSELSSIDSFTETEKIVSKKRNYGLYGIIGGLSGGIMETLLFPIDVARTRMKANVNETILLPTQMKRMYKSEGIRSFYRGYSCTFSGSFIGFAGYFYLYEKMKDVLTDRGILPEAVSPFVSGFISSALLNMSLLPFNVVKTRMQLEPGHYSYKHFFHGARSVIKYEGFRKLYLGGQVFVLQGAVDLSIAFGFYELFNNLLKPFFPKKNNEFNATLPIISSIASSIACAIAINPLDVIVTRLQARNTEIHGSVSPFAMVKKIYAKEGLGGFMKGITGTISFYTLSGLALFPVYEYLKDLFQENQLEAH